MKTSLLKNQQGFTLVELLVALAISGIVLASIFQVFSNSQTTYNVQQDVAEMQQNVRTAKLFLERDIRMAGSGAMNLGGPNEAEIFPLVFENGNGPTGTDRLTIVYRNPDNDDCGTPLPGTISCSTLPTLTLSATMPASSAEANVNGDIATWASQTCSCNGITYDPGDNMPFVVTSPDMSQTEILIKSQVNAPSGKLQDNSNIHYGQLQGAEALYAFLGLESTAILGNKSLNEFPADSRINFFNTQSMYRAMYYVADDANGVPVLYRDTGAGLPAVIAENIEDFQCSFTLDNGTVVNNHDLTNAEIPKVRLVTINVVGRSRHQYRHGYGSFNGQRMALEDHGAGPVDNYRRRLLTMTLKVRNFGLN